MNDIKNNVITNTNLNNGQQFFYGDIYNNVVNNEHHENLNYIYNNSNYEKTSIDKETMFSKIEKIVSIIAGIIAILSFVAKISNALFLLILKLHFFNDTLDKIISITFIISFLFLIIFSTSKNKRIVESLHKKDCAVRKNKVIIKSKNGDIYSVSPPLCPECKNTDSVLKLVKVSQNSENDNSSLITILIDKRLKNEQKMMWQYKCKNNHTFEIDSSKFSLPEE